MSARWLVMVLLLGARPLPAGDWPQILGPNRNGVAVDEKLPGSLPAKGPRVVWQKTVGSGFSGVAVVGETVVLFHRIESEEVVEALNAADGNPRWRAGFPTNYRPSYVDDDGPRCVPVVHNGAVYVYGAAGNLHSVSLKDGAKRWSRAAFKEFGAQEGYFGAGSTPIVEGDKLLVNVGGDGGAGLVAFSLADGKTVWKATGEGASYSSPVAVTQDGARQVIFTTRLSTLSIDPANGDVRWKFPFGQRGPTVNGASPVVVGDHLFVTASYGIGAVWARFDKSTVTTEWSNDDSLSSQYTTSVAQGAYLYGIHGRQDQGVAVLRCIEAATGKVQWTAEDFGKATLILADGKLLILKTEGTLVLAEASPKAYRELGTAGVFDETARALPALSRGRLYARDTRTLKCLELNAP